MGQTLFEKIWAEHIVVPIDATTALIYIDLQLLHEVTSPQAFEGLRLANRGVRRPELNIATVDHNIPTDVGRSLKIENPESRLQVETLRENVKEFGIRFYDIKSPEQGIVHVLGPEQGYVLPGKTVVCGDSHTSTHGAFGAFALGIGTSQVEHVLATQTLQLNKPQTMVLNYKGDLPFGVTAKDLILHTIRKIGVAGGAGYVFEYRGDAISNLDMEGRMTICNMSIEGGARAGMIAPDETTFKWLEGRPNAPRGKQWEQALEYWQGLPTDPDASYDNSVDINCEEIAPCVSWGTNPSQIVGVDDVVPEPDQFESKSEQESAQRALEYMDLTPGTPIADVTVDRVFIGSCTNARVRDLRAAARVVQGRKVHKNIRAMVVPGSTLTKFQAEQEGLDQIFRDAGFEWREAGCSMCLGMNPDILSPGERCASTSNRNFEGRQGKGGRTHLVSPATAAATAIAGRFVDVREWQG